MRKHYNLRAVIPNLDRFSAFFVTSFQHKLSGSNLRVHQFAGGFVGIDCDFRY